MFRWYGLLGVLLILFVETNFFLRIQPFANWYFPIIWFGYILVVDALVYKLRKDSLISNRFSQFLGMIIISMLFWWIFEFMNLSVRNWRYSGLQGLGSYANLFGSLSFSTVLPAFFETVELLRTLHIFEWRKLHKGYRLTSRFLRSMIGFGVVCLLAAILLPKFAFPLVWASFFFILDPMNYIHKQPSVIRHLKDKKLALPLSLLLAGIILGFFWEFWNYWAVPKWSYDIPFVGFFKLFEMPILGYLGYFPFAFELYAMYWFVRSLFLHKEHLLSS